MAAIKAPEKEGGKSGSKDTAKAGAKEAAKAGSASASGGPKAAANETSKPAPPAAAAAPAPKEARRRSTCPRRSPSAQGAASPGETGRRQGITARRRRDLPRLPGCAGPQGFPTSGLDRLAGVAARTGRTGYEVMRCGDVEPIGQIIEAHGWEAHGWNDGRDQHLAHTIGRRPDGRRAGRGGACGRILGAGGAVPAPRPHGAGAGAPAAAAATTRSTTWSRTASCRR